MTASALEQMDVINESEDFDWEYGPPSIPFEDLLYELDVSRYYRKICVADILDESRCLSSQREKKSKSVQTEPVASNTPHSWLLEGEKLVDQMYTGLGNLINRIYHTPGSCENDLKKFDRLKYFTYQNGYYQSTLLPNIKIPGSDETVRQSRAFYAEDTKKALYSLLEVASKLRNIIPYIIETDNSDKPEAEKDLGCIENSSGELKRSACPCERGSQYDMFNVEMDSERSTVCSLEYCRDEKTKNKRMKEESVPKTRKGIFVDDSCELSKTLGVLVSKYYRPGREFNLSQNPEQPEMPVLKRNKSDVNESSKRSGLARKASPVVKPKHHNVLASRSNEKRTTYNGNSKLQYDVIDSGCRSLKGKGIPFDQENKVRIQNHESRKVQGSDSKSKTGIGFRTNFIKRNIMALRNAANRVGSNAVSVDLGCNLEASETKSEKHVSTYTKEARKFLR